MKSFKSGTVEFKDTGWTAFVRGLDQIDKRAVKVGFLFESPKREGKKQIGVAQLAAIHEFGAPSAGRYGMTRIMPRPFIRPTADAKRAYFQEKQKEYLQAIIQGLVRNGRAMNLNQALAEMGEKMAGFIQQTIIDMQNPPNALSVQLAKGRKLLAKKGGRVKRWAVNIRGKQITGYVLRKGSERVVNPPRINNPLVDTGQMAGSVRWAITTDLKGGI